MENNNVNSYNKVKCAARPRRATGLLLFATLVPATLTQAGVEPRLDGGVLAEGQRRADAPPRVSRGERTVIRARLPKLSTSLASLKLSIREFRIEGLSAVSADAIDEVLTPWKNRELSFAEFEQAVHAVAEHLRANGHPNAEVRMSRALVGDGAVAVAIQGLSTQPTQLALKPKAEEIAPSVHVSGFRVSGVTLASADEVQQLLAPFTGRALSFKQMEEAGQVVANHLRAMGYPLVQAYLPPQRVDGGIVEIAVQEGAVDGKSGRNGVVIEGGGERVKSEIVQELIAGRIEPGLPLKMAVLERGVLLANDLAGIKSVKTTLVPGTDTGTTRIEAKVEETRLVSGAVWADNYGSRFTGEDRLNAQINLNSPFGRGEQLSLNAATASGMSSGKIAVQTPVGVSGAKLGASYSQMKLKLGEEIVPLNLNSETKIASLYGNYAIWRGAERNLWLSANYDNKRVMNNVAGFRENDRTIGLVNLGVAGDAFDPLGGQLSFGTSYAHGNADLSASPSYRDLDEQTAQTSGGFGKLNWNFARLARIGSSGAWTWQLSASGQSASKNLDSSEKFQLGGPTGVRAYPVGEGLGDSGWLGSAELRYSFKQTALGTPQAFAFYDTGHITQYRNLWTNALAPDRPNSYSLSGWGLGASLNLSERGSLRVLWAKKAGTNPNPTLTGTDSDGSNKSGRIWIVGTILF